MKKYLCGLFRHEPIVVKDKEEARKVFNCADCSDFPSCYGGPRRTALPHEYRDLSKKMAQVIGDVINLNGNNYMVVVRTRFQEIKELRSKATPVSWEVIADMYGLIDPTRLQNTYSVIKKEVQEGAGKWGGLNKILTDNFECILKMKEKDIPWRTIQATIPELENFTLESIRTIFKHVKDRRKLDEQARND